MKLKNVKLQAIKSNEPRGYDSHQLRRASCILYNLHTNTYIFNPILIFSTKINQIKVGTLQLKWNEMRWAEMKKKIEKNGIFVFSEKKEDLFCSSLSDNKLDVSFELCTGSFKSVSRIVRLKSRISCAFEHEKFIFTLVFYVRSPLVYDEIWPNWNNKLNFAYSTTPDTRTWSTYNMTLSDKIW